MNIKQTTYFNHTINRRCTFVSKLAGVSPSGGVVVSALASHV